MFLNIATQQTSKNQCKIKKYSQCSGFRSKRADFRSENAEYRSGLEDTARDYRSESFFIFLSAQTVKYLNMFYIRMMYVISTFLPYFFLFISNIFENFKFGRNFSKFTAGMGCRLVAVSVKIGGNRRLPIGKENTGTEYTNLRLQKKTAGSQSKEKLLRICIDKFAKMGPQTLDFAVLPLTPHFIGTDGPTMSFTRSGKFRSGQCLQF